MERRNHCLAHQPNSSLHHHEFTNPTCAGSSVPEAFHPHHWSLLQEMWTRFVSVALVLRGLYLPPSPGYGEAGIYDRAMGVTHMAFH